MTLAEAIQKLADKGDEVYAKVCTVISVDTAKRSCDVKPLDGSADILGVRLQANPELKTGFLVVPVAGSFVVVNFLNKNVAVLALCSELEYIELMGDQFGGLIKVEKLIERMNKIEEAFTQHVHTASSFGAPTTTPQKEDQTPNILINTTKSQIENDKVRHG